MSDEDLDVALTFTESEIAAFRLGPRGCRACKYFVPGMGPAFDDLYGEPPECRKHPNRSYLLSFPFRNTKCKDWRLRKEES